MLVSTNMNKKKTRKTKRSVKLKPDNKTSKIENHSKRTQTTERINKILIWVKKDRRKTKTEKHMKRRQRPASEAERTRRMIERARALVKEALNPKMFGAWLRYLPRESYGYKCRSYSSRRRPEITLRTGECRWNPASWMRGSPYVSVCFVPAQGGSHVLQRSKWYSRVRR